MTDKQIADLGPAFADYLSDFDPHLTDPRSQAHLRTYCHGLLSDLPP